MARLAGAEPWRGAFIPPARTPAGVPFGNPPDYPSLEQATVVVFGAPFDDTATFGKGAAHGPAAIRHVSAHQIETYIPDEGIDVYDKLGIHDLGDFRLARRLGEADRARLQQDPPGDARRPGALRRLEAVLGQFEPLGDIVRDLRRRGKIPILLGGEHTLSYWTLRAVAGERPVVIHFDAHRDAKAEYLGMRLSHTTPMYHFLSEQPGPVDMVQIGIRQSDRAEEEFARQRGVHTIHTRDLRDAPGRAHDWIRRKTRGRPVYVTLDIDVLDIPYTPCTGTPEPFGLTPEEVVGCLVAVHPSATLIGADLMEVALQRGDYREATVGTQLLLRLLARDFVRRA